MRVKLSIEVPRRVMPEGGNGCVLFPYADHRAHRQVARPGLNGVILDPDECPSDRFVVRLAKRCRSEACTCGSPGEAVALRDTFRDTLDQHAALVEQAATFCSRPQVFGRLLVESAGIGEDDLDELAHVHTRAGTYRRSVARKVALARRTGPERLGECKVGQGDRVVAAETAARDANAAATIPVGAPRRGTALRSCRVRLASSYRQRERSRQRHCCRRVP